MQENISYKKKECILERWSNSIISKSIIIPVLKPETETKISGNYRPSIDLSDGKTMERMITDTQT